MDFQKVIKTIEKSSHDSEEPLPPQWIELRKDYKLKARIGKGCFGEVVLGKVRSTKEIVAIKCVPMIDSSIHLLKVIRELSILK